MSEQKLLKQIQDALLRLRNEVPEQYQKRQIDEILSEIEKSLNGAEPPPFEEIYPKAKAVADLLLEMFRHYLEHEIVKEGVGIISKLF